LCSDVDGNICTFAECQAGRCFQAVPQPVGLECSDSNDRTTSDMCQGDGSCAGEDMCVVNDVQCNQPPNMCHQAQGDCFQGTCTYFPRADGTQVNLYHLIAYVLCFLLLLSSDLGQGLLCQMLTSPYILCGCSAQTVTA
jgi:hypothetical protein